MYNLLNKNNPNEEKNDDDKNNEIDDKSLAGTDSDLFGSSIVQTLKRIFLQDSIEEDERNASVIYNNNANDEMKKKYSGKKRKSNDKSGVFYIYKYYRIRNFSKKI